MSSYSCQSVYHFFEDHLKSGARDKYDVYKLYTARPFSNSFKAES